MRQYTFIGGLRLSGLVFLLAVGCGKHEESATAPVGETRQVHTFTTAAVPNQLIESVPGTVRPKLRASIEAKLSGTVEKVFVNEGDQVSAGKSLASLSVREIRAKLEQAQAVQQQTQRDLARFKTLLAQKATTPQEFDTVDSRARVASAAVVEAQTMLSYAEITAPFAGTITHKSVNVGDLAAPGKTLFQLEDPNTLRFEADLAESLITRLAIGQELNVTIAGREEVLPGVISEIAPTADPASRTVLVKVDLPVTPWLRSGAFGHMTVPVREEAGIRIPATAVFRRGQLEYVFAADGTVARLRIVRTGRRFADTVEIVAGLDAGEHIIIDGIDSLTDGQPIQVLQ